MSKPINVVVDYKTHRQDMREAINEAIPKRNLVPGLMIGFACTIALVWSGVSMLATYFGNG